MSIKGKTTTVVAKAVCVGVVALAGSVDAGSCGSGTDQYSALSALYDLAELGDSYWYGWMDGDPCDDYAYWSSITTTNGMHILKSLTLHLSTKSSLHVVEVRWTSLHVYRGGEGPRRVRTHTYTFVHRFGG